MHKHLHAALLFPALLLHPAGALADTAQAAAALNQGRVDDATHMLQTRLSHNPHDATAHQLLCRAFYSVDIAGPAISECESAVADSPASSESFMWLGRAYGLKASRANPISAFALARKVVAAFEHSVELDPHNMAAQSDLGEYYVAAPSIVGGGLDKARNLAARLLPTSPDKAHRLLGMIAEKQGDDITAETEYKKAVEAHRCPETYVDLADFYQRRKQYDQSFTAVQAAIRLDKTKGPAIVDAASILTSMHRDAPLAEQLLQQYLASPAKSDDAPAAKVHIQLADLLRTNGDTDGARREYEAALSLASGYAPAKKALQAL